MLQHDHYQTSAKDAIASEFSKCASHYVSRAKVQQRISQYALSLAKQYFSQRKQTIIDLGCGVGHNLPLLEAFAADVTGFDLAQGMVKHNMSQHPIVCSDFEALPIVDASVDYVFSTMALQWSHSPAKALDEIYRVLRPGGQALCAIMVSPSFTRLTSAFEGVGLGHKINQFAPLSAWESASFSHCAYSEQVFVESFSTFRHMMDSIKLVGAGTVLSTTNASQLTRAAYRDIVSSFGGEFELDYRVCFLHLIR